VRYVPSDAEDEKTPLELAEEAGQTLQAVSRLHCYAFRNALLSPPPLHVQYNVEN